jgi:predicted alpha/beta-fold hydrolase
MGFSLGGNVLLKYLGEQGGGAAETPISAAAVISVPFDLSAGADWIERGVSSAYRLYLVRKLHRKVRRKVELLRPHVDVARLLGARTFREFDGIGTAPLHGFRDAEDYYRRSSSGQFVAAIRVPTLVVHAEDDPFLPPAAVPRADLDGNPFIDCRVTRRGGHVGFVAGPPWAPVFWAEEAAAQFLAHDLAGRGTPPD